jgi:hypothetical protein
MTGSASNDRVAQRAAELTAEEQTAGSDDPGAQAEAILAESDERQANRESAPSTHLEHRTTDETVEPPG